MNPNRYCVIMSGGIGSRFWPYSREEKPKQFIDFLGTGRSLLQMSVDRIRGIVPPEHIIVVTNTAYLDLVRQQCPELDESNILAEPARRNTAPCIAWAARHISAINPDASMIVMPSDHVITDQNAFQCVALDGFAFVENHDALLTLGINPTKPETGYGYIKYGPRVEKDIFKVEKFSEKPDIDKARSFLADGSYLWNAGIFIWKVSTILEELQRYAPRVIGPLEREGALFEIGELFPECEAISIDYAVMEKSQRVYVEKAEMGWNDLGTWSSLFELSDKDNDNNSATDVCLIASSSSGNIIKAPKGKVVVLQHVNDLIIADTGSALLICPKSEEQSIKTLVENLPKEHR